MIINEEKLKIPLFNNIEECKYGIDLLNLAIIQYCTIKGLLGPKFAHKEKSQHMVAAAILRMLSIKNISENEARDYWVKAMVDVEEMVNRLLLLDEYRPINANNLTKDDIEYCISKAKFETSLKNGKNKIEIILSNFQKILFDKLQKRINGKKEIDDLDLFDTLQKLQKQAFEGEKNIFCNSDKVISSQQNISNIINYDSDIYGLRDITDISPIIKIIFGIIIVILIKFYID